MKFPSIISKSRVKLSLLGVVILFSFVLIGSMVAQPAEFRRRASHVVTGYSEEDIKAEIDFGRKLAAKILGKYKIIKNKELQRYISILGEGVAVQIGRPELTYYFAVLETDEINAYACPGGYIFVTKGAIKAMTNEAQMVGVIAHEITHVNERHVVKQLKIKGKDKSVTSGLAGIVGGGTATARIALERLSKKAFQILFEEGLAKEDEFESDTHAVEMLITLNYDWVSYREYIQKLKKLIAQGQGKVISKTHPDVATRINNMNTKAKINQYKNTTGKINAKRFKQYVQF